MSIGEALAEGLRVTVIGMTIVFAVLILLMLVLMAFKLVFYKKEPETSSAQKKTPPDTASTAVKPELDEKELIAVLTAAVAASMNTSTYNLNIKSYKRIGNTSPSWSRAGLNDVINSRF